MRRPGGRSDSSATTVKNTVFRSIRDVAIKLNAATDPAQVSVGDSVAGVLPHSAGVLYWASTFAR